MKVETEILTSRAVARDVVAALGVAKLYPDLTGGPQSGATSPTNPGGTFEPPPVSEERAAARIDANLSAVADKAANVILVEFKARDPDVARKVLNLAVRAYLSRRDTLFADVQSGALAEQAHLAAAQLASATHALEAFKTRNGISDYETQRTLLLHQRDDTIREMHASESSRRQAELILTTIDHALSTTPVQVVTSSDDDVQTRVDRLRATLDEMKAREGGMLVRYGPNSPTLIELKSQIAMTVRQLQQAGRDHVSSSIRRGRSPVYDGLAIDRSRALQDLSASRARIDVATTQLSQEQDALAQLEGQDSELQGLERQHSLLEQHYRSIQNSLEDRQIIEGVNARRLTNVRPINGAQSVVVKQNVRLAALVGGLLLAVFGGLTAMIVSYAFRRGFSTACELERALGMPVFGTIRLEPSNPKPNPKIFGVAFGRSGTR